MKKIKIFIVSLLFIISSGFLLSFDDNDNFEIAKNLDIYYSLFRELNILYVDDTDAGKLIETAIDAMLNSLDPYTVYYSESEIEDVRFMTTGQYGGIGALILRVRNEVLISDPYPNSPAINAGLKAGDIILEIQGKSTHNKSIDDISKALKGPPKSTVKLLIKRPGVEKPFLKSIVREKITVPSVAYHGMLNNEVAYIRLTSFTQKAGNEVKNAFLELKNENSVKSVVLDLRGNPGGLLIEAVNIMNIFVDKGEEIVNTRGKVAQWNNVYKTMLSAVDTEIPLVVLVNRGSASASEIVAGSMQDIDRGIIIGQRTFGKGLVQTTRELSYNSRLKVTTAKYYIPSGRCIQALDYSHRNEDGSVGKIPDSLISEFTTRNGRKVYDGGGIEPDVKLDQNRFSKIAFNLLAENLYFEYATQYALKYDSISKPKEFQITDDEYNEFIEFVKTRDFDYETDREESLKELIRVAKEEEYYDMAVTELEELEKKFKHDMDKDFRLHNDEIRELLNEEIISRYYYQIGRIEANLSKDPGILKAIEILSDSVSYNAILHN
jgi:carboxyl-terminal processing protease